MTHESNLQTDTGFWIPRASDVMRVCKSQGQRLLAENIFASGGASLMPAA